MACSVADDGVAGPYVALIGRGSWVDVEGVSHLPVGDLALVVRVGRDRGEADRGEAVADQVAGSGVGRASPCRSCPTSPARPSAVCGPCPSRRRSRGAARATPGRAGPRRSAGPSRRDPGRSGWGWLPSSTLSSSGKGTHHVAVDEALDLLHAVDVAPAVLLSILVHATDFGGLDSHRVSIETVLAARKCGDPWRLRTTYKGLDS